MPVLCNGVVTLVPISMDSINAHFESDYRPEDPADQVSMHLRVAKTDNHIASSPLVMLSNMSSPSSTADNNYDGHSPLQ